MSRLDRWWERGGLRDSTTVTGTGGHGFVVVVGILRVQAVEVPGWLDVEDALARRGIILEIAVADGAFDDGGWDACGGGGGGRSYNAGTGGADPGGTVGADRGVGGDDGDGGGGVGGVGVGCAEGGCFGGGRC